MNMTEQQDALRGLGELVERDGVLHAVEDGWYADDGNAEVHYPSAETGRAAAQEYVDDGDWSDGPEAWVIMVHVWRRGWMWDDDENEVVEVRLDEDSHDITLQPDEPGCRDDDGHRWEAPHVLVGGIESNPGVWGHGGGIVINEACVRCGCQRKTDTWATNPSNGTPFEAVSYDENYYSEAIEERIAAKARAGDLQILAETDGTEWSASLLRSDYYETWVVLYRSADRNSPSVEQYADEEQARDAWDALISELREAS